MIHRPGRKHNNVDALSRVACQWCGRSDNQPVATRVHSELLVATITSANTTGGFTLEKIRTLQLDDTIVSKLLRAKETNLKPTDTYTKAQGIEYGKLSQQWDQLTVCDGVLWQCFAQPQLVTACGGTLILEEPYSPGHFHDVHNWCESCISCTTKDSCPWAKSCPWEYCCGVSHADHGYWLSRSSPRKGANTSVLVVTDYPTRSHHPPTHHGYLIGVSLSKPHTER